MKAKIVGISACVFLMFSCKKIDTVSDEHRISIPIIGSEGHIVLKNSSQFSEAFVEVNGKPTGPYIKYEPKGNILTKRIYHENEMLFEKRYYRKDNGIDSVVLVSKVFAQDSSFFIGEVLNNDRDITISYPVFTNESKPIIAVLQSKGLDRMAVSVGENYGEDLSQKHYFSDPSKGTVFIKPSYEKGVYRTTITLLMLNRIQGTEDEYNTKEIYLPIISMFVEENNLPGKLKSKTLNRKFIF